MSQQVTNAELFELITRLRTELEEEKLKTATFLAGSTSLQSQKSTISVATTMKSNDFEHKHELQEICKSLKLHICTVKPTSETIFDDAVDDVENKVNALGGNIEIMKYIIFRIGDATVRQNIGAMDDTTCWHDMRQQLSRQMFRHSDQLRTTEAEVQKLNRNKDIEESIQQVRQKVERCKLLADRWDEPFIFNDKLVKRCIERKLPTKIAIAINDVDTSAMDVQEHIDEIRRIIGAHQRTEDIRAEKDERYQTLCISHTGTPESLPAQETQVPEASERPPRCWKCSRVGHKGAECRNPRWCEICKQYGHTDDWCAQTKAKMKVGTLVTNTRSFPKGGTNTKTRVEATQIDLYKTMLEDHAQKIKQLEVATQRAKNKRASTKDHKRSMQDSTAMSNQSHPSTHNVADKVENDMSDDNEEQTDIIEETLNAATLQNNGVRLYVYGVINERKLTWLVDSGSTSSLMSYNTWDAMHKCGIIVSSRTSEVLGLENKTKVYCKVLIPVTVGNTCVEEVFLITDVKKNILGSTWMSLVQARVSYHGPPQLELPGQEPINTIELYHVSEACYTSDEVATPPENTSPEVRQILNEYRHVWESPKMGTCTAIVHRIKLVDHSGLRQKPRKLNDKLDMQVETQIQKLLDHGAIEPSNSPIASPITVAYKRDHSIRMCIDYRKVNAKTIPDAFPMAPLKTLITRMSGAEYFTSLDMSDAYHHVTVDPRDRYKTAFVTSYGLYQYKVLPFGLRNAPATFQRLMNMIIKDIGIGRASAYLDDIVLFDTTKDRHLENLRHTLNVLSRYGVFLKIAKCEFERGEIRYLGMKISKHNITIDENRLTKVRELTPPKDVTSLQRFLGCTNYYRKFIDSYAHIAHPLYTLLQKDNPWIWTENEQTVFEHLKCLLTQQPIILAIPDLHKEFTLDTDASGIAIAAILQQEDNKGKLRTVAYASRTLRGTEKHWHIGEQEALAIAWSVEYFRDYLLTAPHTLINTDHKNLKWIWHMTSNRRIERWALLLQAYNLTIRYRQGKMQEHVDMLTRNFPAVDDEDGDRAWTQMDMCIPEDSTYAVETVTHTSDQPRHIPTMQEIITECNKPSVLKVIKNLPLENRDGLYITATNRIYIPQRFRFGIMYTFHSSLTGGHQGVGRMSRKISQLFYWPHMKANIEQHVKSCLVCIQHKRVVSPKTTGDLLTFAPFDILGIDIFGPIVYHRQERHVLVFIDHYTRFVCLSEVTRTITSMQVWELLLEKWISHFGTPRVILSDNASYFCGTYLMDKLASMQIRKAVTTPYYPQGNSIVENFNRTLKLHLSVMENQYELTFKETLACISLIQNTTPQLSTAETPCALLYGLDPKTPESGMWSYLAERYDQDTHWRLVQQLRDEATEKLIYKYQHVFLKDPPKGHIQVGDLVFKELSNYEFKQRQRSVGSRKLLANYSEPYRVLRYSDTSKRQFVITSLFPGKPDQIANTNQLIRIPKNIPEEHLNQFILELIHNTTTFPENQRKRLMNQRLEQLPPGKRALLKGTIKELKDYNESWVTPTSEAT